MAGGDFDARLQAYQEAAKENDAVSGDTSPVIDLPPRTERAGFPARPPGGLQLGNVRQACVVARCARRQHAADRRHRVGQVHAGRCAHHVLVPPAKLAYNKAAGAETKERTLRIVRARPLQGCPRGRKGSAPDLWRFVIGTLYSVVLARFANTGLDETVTLRASLWSKDAEGQPARMYVVADEALSIAGHFSGFGTEMATLKRRLRRAGFEVHDSFPRMAQRSAAASVSRTSRRSTCSIRRCR